MAYTEKLISLLAYGLIKHAPDGVAKLDENGVFTVFNYLPKFNTIKELGQYYDSKKAEMETDALDANKYFYLSIILKNENLVERSLSADEVVLFEQLMAYGIFQSSLLLDGIQKDSTGIIKALMGVNSDLTVGDAVEWFVANPESWSTDGVTIFAV